MSSDPRPWYKRLFTKPTALEPRKDAWENAITGWGTSRDKTAYTTFDGCQDDVTPQEGERLWSFEPLAAKIVEKLPDETLRQGFEVHIPDDGDLADDLEAYCEDRDIEGAFRLALKMERAMGGSALYCPINDGKAQDEELNINNISSIGPPVPLDCLELQVAGYQSDITLPGYGKPLLYRFSPRGVTDSTGISPLIHASRLIIFPGIQTSKFMQRTRAGAPGWGFSVLGRVQDVLKKFNLGWGSAANMLSDFAQTVLKIKGLALLAGANEKAAIQQKLLEQDLYRSVMRMMVLDGEDEWSRESTSMAGVADVLDRLMTLVAAASDTPVSILFGDAPAGLNATGQADRSSFQDTAQSVQRVHLKPRLNQYLKWVMLAKDGPTGGKEPDHWEVKFKSFEQLSELESATLRKTQADTDKIYFDMGLSPEEILTSRFGKGGYSTETVVDFEARASLDLGPKEPEPVAEPADKAQESEETEEEPEENKDRQDFK